MMSEFKGTKGKWEINRYGYPNYENMNCGRHTINIGVDIWFGDVNPVKSVQEAKYNALLISKAPEMLEMLEKAKSLLGNVGEFEVTKEIEQLIKEATEI